MKELTADAAEVSAAASTVDDEAPIANASSPSRPENGQPLPAELPLAPPPPAAGQVEATATAMASGMPVAAGAAGAESLSSAVVAAVVVEEACRSESGEGVGWVVRLPEEDEGGV